MTKIIEKKVVRAGELPAQRRGGIDPAASVLVTVENLTENGFTEAFEQRVLDAEKEIESAPFRPAADVIKELKTIAANES